MATIDRLEIQIEAQASNANKQLDLMASKLGRISQSLGASSSGLNLLATNIQKISSSISMVDSAKISSIATSIRNLSDSATGFKKDKSTELFSLANALKKFNQVDTNSVYGISSAIQNLSVGMASMTGINADGIASVATAMSKLGSIKAIYGTENLIKVKDDLKNFVAGLNQVGSVNFNTESLTLLIDSIRKLGGKSASSATENLPKIKNDLIQFVSGLNELKSISFDLTGLSELVTSLSKLGGKSVANAVTNIPLLANALKELMATLSKSPQVNQNVIQMTNSLANLASQGSRIGTATSSLNRNILSYNNSAKKATKSTMSLAAAFGRFYASTYLAIRGVKALGKAIESSMDFLETVNYFEVAMRQIGDSASAGWEEAGYNSAEAYAESFSARAKQLTEKMTGYAIDTEGNATSTGQQSLGLDPNQVLQYQAVFAQMSNSIGVAEESALNFSKALTMLGADWASLRNISFDQSWEKFASALAGQSRAVRSLGIDITMATLQEVAYANGVQTAVQEMNQATKAQLRLLAILKQSEVAFGDLANTISSPSNQLRLLQQNFANLARTIGNLFLPIVSKILPVVNGIVIALQRLFQWIGALLGIKFDTINSSMGGMSDSMSDLVGGTDDYEDSLEEANKAAKKLKTTVLGIDELNINAPDEDSGKDANKPTGGGGIPELDIAISDALLEYEKIWNDAFDRMENKAQDFADNVERFFKKIWDVAEPTREALSRLWNEGLKELGQFSADTLKDFYNNFLVPVGKWLLGNDAGLPRLFNVLNKMLTDIDWGVLRNSLYDLYTSMSNLAIFAFDSLFDFMEYFLAPLGTWVMSSALPQLVDILKDFIDSVNWDKINTSLERFWKALLPFAQAVGQGMINFFRDLAKIGASFINIVVPGGINALASALEKIDPRTVERISYALSALVTAYLGFKGISKVKGIIAGAFTALYSSTVLKGLKNVTTKMIGFADSIPIVTSALKGNQNAANALATFYPQLNKVVVGASDAFGIFKANLQSGAFFQNTLTDIKAWGAGLSGVTKSIIGVTAVFAEFNVLKNVFEDMTLGTENVAIGIGKITVAVGLAVGALKLIGLSNPFTAIIVGITGVVAGIMGISTAMEKIETESIGNSIKNALTAPGGTPLSEISAGFATVMGEIGGSFSLVTEKTEVLKQADSNIRSTWLEIEKIETAMDAGVLSVDEGNVELARLFGELATTAATKFGALEDTLLAAFGENGVLTGVYNRLGISTENTTSTIIALNDKVEKRIEELTKLLSETDPTNPNYKTYKDELSSLMTQTDELTTAMSNYDLALSQIDYSDLTDEYGKLDDAKLTEFLSGIATATETANTNVTTAIAGIKTSLTDELNAALAIGDTQSAKEIQEKLSALTDALTILKEDIALKSAALTDTVQKDLVGKLPDVIKQAGEEWENNSSPFKGDKSTFISNAVREYQDNFLTPVSGQIESVISQFGIDGAGWSKAAGEKIIGGLFDVTAVGTVGYSGATMYRKALKDNYESVITGAIDDARPGITNAASGLSGDFVDGYQIPIKDAKIDASNMGTTAAGSLQTEQDSDSPSKVSYGLGLDWIHGYNNAITENSKSTVDAVTSWMDSVKAYFTDETWTALFSGMTTAFQTQWTALTEYWNSIALPLWMEESVLPWFSTEKWLEITDGMKLGITGKWTEFTVLWKTNFTKWWKTDIEPWFSVLKWTAFGKAMSDGIFKGFEGITSSVAGILNKLIKSFESAMNQIVGAVNDFVSDYNGMAKMLGTDKLSKFSGFSFGDIPKFATGAVVTRPTFSMIGENGPEAIVPLRNNTEWMDGVSAGILENMGNSRSDDLIREEIEVLKQNNSLMEKLIQAVEDGKIIEMDGRELTSAINNRNIRNGYPLTT